jgi:acyl-CoA synthetase (AMP-forming)/AMP-acid ligase II
MVANGLLREAFKRETHRRLCHTSHYFQEIFYGSQKLGGYTTLNWRLVPRELEFVIDDADVSLLFVAEQYWPNVKAIRETLTKVKKIIIQGAPVPERSITIIPKRIIKDEVKQILP